MPSSRNTPMPSSFDGDSEFYEENGWQKLKRRLKEEPLIPLGCILTSLALFSASRSIKAGDHNRTNRMFRARIYAQGFTLVAMIAGSMYWQTDRQKRKEFDSAVSERKAKEKNEAWIRELEAREKEDREEKEKRMKGLRGKMERKVTVKTGEEAETAREIQRTDGGVKNGEGASSMVEESERKKESSVLAAIGNAFSGKK